MEKTPTSLRIVAILHLCLVFTLVCWLMGYPFMGQLFATKSKMQIVETSMGTFGAEQAKMHRNQERFATLPQKQQTALHHYYDELKQLTMLSFSKKLSRSFHIIAYEISFIQQLWIVFSIIIPLLFLMHSEGAKQAVLLLPLIALFYMMDNTWNGCPLNHSKEAQLFPTEEMITTEYLKEPLSQSIRKQREQLTLGWHLYLIDQWARETPAIDPIIRTGQIEKGEHAFLTARALAQATETPTQDSQSLRRKQPFAILMLYLLWNSFFAWFVNRKRKEIPCPSY